MGAKRTKQKTVNLMLRLPPHLHADLVRLASAQMPPVSLNHCIVTQLIAAVLRDKIEHLSLEELRRFLEYGRRTLAAAEREAAGRMPSNIPLPPTNEDMPPAVRPKPRRLAGAAANDDPPPVINLAARLKRADPRKKKGVA
jgi:hypothetical protein